MAVTPDATLTVGDRQFSLPFRLLNPDGTIATLTSCTLRMVNVEDNSVKVSAGTVTIASFTVGGLACNARYSFAATDVDTPGVYAIQVTDTAAGPLAQHWPAGRQYLLEIKAVI